MSEILKHLSERLHRQYGRIVRRPMPWRMIDVLVSLEEKLESRGRKDTSRDVDHTADIETSSDDSGEMRAPTSHRND